MSSAGYKKLLPLNRPYLKTLTYKTFKFLSLAFVLISARNFNVVSISESRAI